jgi:hypothetical protein
MRFRVLIVVSLASLLPEISWGQDSTQWAPTPPVPPAAASNSGDMGAITDRLHQLEAETQALRDEVRRMQEQTHRLPAVEATPTAMAVSSAAPPVDTGDYYTLDQLRGEMKKLVWTKGDFSIVPYGILWGNMVYSTERTTPGSYTLYVQSASTQPESEFLVDARNTRLGIDVGGPSVGCCDSLKTGGKVEIDFQNSVLTTENKGTLLLRHAYVEAKNEDYRLLAGQTWDVISPLYPGMLMYSIGWDGGNIGYRRAQFRGERFLNFSDTSLVTTQLSANQTVFEDGTTNIVGEPPNWPILEGRVAWTIGERGKDCRPMIIGISGHIGEEQSDIATLERNHRNRTWSGNIDFRMPITERLGVQAECFTGENLGAFLGGIGQGIDPVTFQGIRSTGGWFEIWYDWMPWLHSHVGYSVDDPNDHDLRLAGERCYNQFFFGNISYDVTKTFLMGIEVSSWKTNYVDRLAGDSVRSEFVVKYSF